MKNLDHIHFEGADLSAADVCVRPRSLRGASAPRANRSTTESKELDPFLGWVLEQAGLDARAYRPKALERRLASCLRWLRVESPAAARAVLEQRREMIPGLLDTVLIGVTEFFRDAAVFDVLRDVVLPEQLGRRKGLRVLCVGVSDGPELYSLAMLLGEAGALERSDLLGIDCRPYAIARAETAVYTDEEIAGVPALLRERYFEPWGRRFRLVRAVRERTRWRAADLRALPPAGRWDIVLFRNVAIYLDDSFAQRTWKQLYTNLNTGGHLITGKAEKPPAAFPFSRLAPSVYRKMEGSLP